jgi:hypothetical protein
VEVDVDIMVDKVVDGESLLCMVEELLGEFKVFPYLPDRPNCYILDDFFSWRSSL